MLLCHNSVIITQFIQRIITKCKIMNCISNHWLFEYLLGFKVTRWLNWSAMIRPLLCIIKNTSTSRPNCASIDEQGKFHIIIENRKIKAKMREQSEFELNKYQQFGVLGRESKVRLISWDYLLSPPFPLTRKTNQIWESLLQLSLYKQLGKCLSRIERLFTTCNLNDD